LAQNLSTFKLFSDVPEFKDQYSPYVNAMKELGFKEGGRVKKAIGSPMMGEQPVESQEIISSQTKTIGSDTQEKPVLNLSYDELRIDYLEKLQMTWYNYYQTVKRLYKISHTS